VNNVVAKRYPLSLAVHSELRKDLEGWLGPNAMEMPTIEWTSTFELLIGQKADLEVVHIHNPGYTNPFVFPKRIMPPGV